MDAKRLAIAALVAGLMIAAPAAAQGTFTEAWAGTWNLEEGLRTCDTTVILGTSERTVEIAAGDSPADWDNQLSFSAASVDITDTVFDYGGGSTVIDGGCTVVTTVDYDMTRDGDSLTGLKRVDKTNVVDQFLLWDDLPEPTTILGAVVVALGGLYILYRETRVTASARGDPGSAAG